MLPLEHCWPSGGSCCPSAVTPELCLLYKQCCFWRPWGAQLLLNCFLVWMSWLQLPIKSLSTSVLRVYLPVACVCTCSPALKCCSFSATVCGHFLYLCTVLEQSVINILGIQEVKDGPKLPDSSLVHRKELDRKSQDWVWSAKHSCHYLSTYLDRCKNIYK